MDVHAAFLHDLILLGAQSAARMRPCWRAPAPSSAQSLHPEASRLQFSGGLHPDAKHHTVGKNAKPAGACRLPRSPERLHPRGWQAFAAALEHIVHGSRGSPKTAPRPHRRAGSAPSREPEDLRGAFGPGPVSHALDAASNRHAYGALLPVNPARIHRDAAQYTTRIDKPRGPA